jgi:hypothetical protein
VKNRIRHFLFPAVMADPVFIAVDRGAERTLRAPKSTED